MDRKGFAAKVADGYAKGEDDEAMPEGEGMDDDTAAKNAAGEELAAAIKSGKGSEIYAAFEALKELCEGG
jgi:hypothetical protein